MDTAQKWIDLLKNNLNIKYRSHFEVIPIKPDDLVFEERVLMNCFYCGKHGNNWRCPPNIPKLDYKKMFSEFEFGAFVCLRLPYIKETYTDVRNESALILHRQLLDMEKILWNENRSMALSFIGGSCRLCKNGCGKEKCNNPYLARSPLEATGINVVESGKKYGVDIVFPPTGYMTRVGLLLW